MGLLLANFVAEVGSGGQMSRQEAIFEVGSSPWLPLGQAITA